MGIQKPLCESTAVFFVDCKGVWAKIGMEVSPMKLSDILIIVATILGPILAVQAQKYLEKWRESNDRKSSIFKTLMATRATRLDPQHVQSLNLIDVEFYHKNGKYRPVIEAWKAYNDHLSQKPEDEAKKAIWGEKVEEMLADLLHQMGKSIGYEFDKTHIRRAAYYPQGHGELEDDQLLLRKALLAVFAGNKPIAMNVVGFPDMEDTDSQKEMHRALIQLLKQAGDAPTNQITVGEAEKVAVLVQQK